VVLSGWVGLFYWQAVDRHRCRRFSPPRLSPRIRFSPSNPEGACNAGDAKGCFELGFLFEEGRGVSKDKVGAAAAFARGCALGDQNSCARAQE